jgi:hypothetical protein
MPIAMEHIALRKEGLRIFQSVFLKLSATTYEGNTAPGRTMSTLSHFLGRFFRLMQL